MPCNNSDTAAGWQRVGARVRHARLRLGYTSREHLAEACHVSVRVISDLESGKRCNFSHRVIARLENTLHWPAGTLKQIADDADFVPPAPSADSGFLFREPVFDRRPVYIDVPAVEQALAALAAGEHVGTDQGIYAATAALCRPYVARLMEDNCLPGRQLHPSVRPLYEAFVRMSQTLDQAEPANRYLHWLAGEVTNVAFSADEQRRYAARWQDSRRTSRKRQKCSAL